MTPDYAVTYRGFRDGDLLHVGDRQRVIAYIRSGVGTAAVIVEKRRQLNPSARGGAYRMVWTATARGQVLTADTRKGAVAAAVRYLRERGFSI